MRTAMLMTLALLALPALADDLVLVDGGRPAAAIVAAEEDAAAAEELQTYLRKMSGAEVAIVATAPEGARIVLGGLEGDVGLDGYAIRRNGPALHLAGATPAGTLNAVYRFLDGLGVRWYIPGEVGEVVPERATIAVGDLDEVSQPDYLHRMIWPSLAGRGMSAQDRAEWSQWARRNLYGGVPVHVGHNFRGIASADEYFEQHPDWFALRDGERDRSGQLCTSNPQVIEHTVAVARRWFDENLGQTMFSLSPDDHARFCHCPDCEALDPPEYRGLDTGKGRRLLVFANEVAERLQETHPGKNVAFYAYWGAVEAPGDIEAHPNVIVFFTPIGMAFNYPLQDSRSPTNRVHDGWYHGWDSVAHQMGIRHYYNFSSVLWIPWRVLTDELRYEFERDAMYMNAELWSDAEGSALSYWILARVLWDVDADIDALFDDYVTGLYGVAAEPMRRYYARLTDAFSYGPEELLWPRSLERQRPYLRMLTPEVLSACHADLREARALARSDDVLTARVRISQAWLGYMSAWRRFAALQLGVEEGTVAEQARAAAELLDSIELVQRYAPGAMPEIERILVPTATQFAWLAEGADELEPAFPDAPAHSPEEPPTLFRGASRHLILSSGEPFELTIGHRQVGSSADAVRWQIMGPGGSEITGQVPVGEEGHVTVDPAAEGIYAVVLQAGSNAGSVESTARYLVHDASNGLSLVYRARPLHFTVPRGVGGFSVSMACSSVGESVHAAVIDPEGAVVAEQDVHGSVTMEVAVPAGMSGQPWRVELSPAAEGVYEDVERLRFSPEIPPFATDAPGRLVAED